jgi:hypothetical protein
MTRARPPRTHGTRSAAPPPGYPDPTVARLGALFRTHPAWVAAARSLSDSSTSRVFFSHRPGEAWHLARRKGETLLLAGGTADPDLCFRFPPGAVERLASTRGGIGDFAVELFGLIVEEEPDLHVDLRIAAPFARLARRGFLGLLLRGGPKVLVFGAAHGVRTLSALRRFVATQSAGGPAPWETGTED